MDLKVEFKAASRHQLKMMFSNFYPKAKEEIAAEFADRILAKYPESMAMAKLQEHFIRNRCSTAEECLADVENYEAPSDDAAPADADEKDGDEKADESADDSDSDSSADSSEAGSAVDAAKTTAGT